MSAFARSLILVAVSATLLGCASPRLIDPPKDFDPFEETDRSPQGMRWATPAEKSYLSDLVVKLSEVPPDNCAAVGLAALAKTCGAESGQRLPILSVVLPPEIAPGQRIDSYVELAPGLCLGQMSLSTYLPDGWTARSLQTASVHGGGEWAEAYDSPGLEARLMVTGAMGQDASFCGRRLSVIRWRATRAPASGP